MKDANSGTIRDLIKRIEDGVSEADRPAENSDGRVDGPVFTFLIGAGFSMTAGLSGISHLVLALQDYQSNPDRDWYDILDDTADQMLKGDWESTAKITDYYFDLIGQVLPEHRSRHDFITAAIQWASSKRVQMNVEGILLAALMIAGTGGKIPLQDNRKEKHWLAKVFSKHVFTTNFDEVVPNTFYYGNKPLDIIDAPGVREIGLKSEYPTIIYLHGRHLHYDLRNTKLELHLGTNEQKENSETDNSDLFSDFKNLLKHTGLIVIGYAGAKDRVTKAILETLDDPQSLPYGLWWSVYRRIDSIAPHVREAIESNANARYFEQGSDAEQLMRNITSQVGIDESAALNLWRDRLEVISSEVNRFLERASFNFRQFQLEGKQALMFGSTKEVHAVLKDWPKMKPHVLDHSDKQLVAELLNLAGNLMTHIGEKVDAREAFQKAEELLRMKGRFAELMEVLIDYGEFSILTGDFQRAKDMFKEAHTYYKKNEKPLLLAQSKTKTAEAMISLGELEPAKRLLKQSVQICEKYQYDLGLGNNELVYGKAALESNQLAESIIHFNNSVSLFKADGHEASEIIALLELANAYGKDSQTEAALDKAAKAYKKATDLGAERLRMQSLITLSEIQTQMGDNEKALKYRNEAAEMLKVYFDHKVEMKLDTIDQ